MFQKIQQLIDDKDALVFVLIDEVKHNLQFKIQWKKKKCVCSSCIPGVSHVKGVCVCGIEAVPLVKVFYGV